MAYLTIEEERKKVREAYPWGPWQQKVDRMSEAQVHAVYKRLLEQKKI